MDSIDARLRETSDTCLKAYEAWTQEKKNGKARQALQESVHELRKVASRLEIEVAISERDEMTQKPIPVPPHRDSNKKSNNNNNDDRGNRAPANEGQGASGGAGGGAHSKQRSRKTLSTSRSPERSLEQDSNDES